MRSTNLVAVATLAALGLSACHKAGGANDRVCAAFPQTAVNAADAAAVLDDCLHRWTYSLAASPDPAEAVAQASIAACAPALARWNQQGLAPGQGLDGAPQPGGSEAAPSLLTGQPTTPIAEHYTYAQGRALFYVVQARAGKCAPPPAPTPQAGGNSTTG
jgi:hypothetical protein